jgi:hypothetical protein
VATSVRRHSASWVTSLSIATLPASAGAATLDSRSMHYLSGRAIRAAVRRDAVAAAVVDDAEATAQSAPARGLRAGIVAGGTADAVGADLGVAAVVAGLAPHERLRGRADRGRGRCGLGTSEQAGEAEHHREAELEFHYADRNEVKITAQAAMACSINASHFYRRLEHRSVRRLRKIDRLADPIDSVERS